MKKIFKVFFFLFILFIFSFPVSASQPEWPLDFESNISIYGETLEVVVRDGKVVEAGFRLNKSMFENSRYKVVPDLIDISQTPTDVQELHNNYETWYYMDEKNYANYQELETDGEMIISDDLTLMEFAILGAAGYHPAIIIENYHIEQISYRQGVLEISVNKHEEIRYTRFEIEGYPDKMLEGSVTDTIKYRFLNRAETSRNLRENQADWDVEKKVDRYIDVFKLKNHYSHYLGHRNLGSFKEEYEIENTRMRLSNLGNTVKEEADRFDAAGSISYVYGIVEIKKLGSDEWVNAKQQDQLIPGDRIRTGRASHVEIVHEKAQKIISLNPNSDVEFKEELKARSKWSEALRMFFGFIYINGKETEGELNVHTPKAICGSRGTIYSIEVDDEQGVETFSVYQGTIVIAAAENIDNYEEIDNEKLDEIGTFLEAGQRIKIDQDGNISSIENLSDAEIKEGIKNSEAN
ncbi:FecR domain-containing protein [Halanaerobium hydrogeniformans]|uniref:FecR protein domain-containing protein n=1 Tax=Halanaerobium hydrogeniformans TaxID=656519 RepID=E4RPI2_HALHG|nr:FecR domain-containing protein [Halanaerobium hydrogeniformans]ADQ14005.1 hypothetical protein Halsa_0537 [Halanaerobium hydrogeniformans]